jgi:UDP-GlcNAc:undecaprenyl-phosphate GlcNAc-1-phosphate transferase
MFLQDVFSQYWGVAISSFLLGLLLVLVALKVFPRFGLMDRPHRYGLLRKSIPYYGGIVIFLAFVVLVLLFVPLTKTLIGLLVGGAMIFVLGFLDDLLGLNPFLRLGVQFLASVALVVFGVGILSINLPFIGVLDFSEPVVFGIMIVSAIFTVLWVMVILNTVNFVDGVSGLTSGIGFIAGMTLFILSVHPGVHVDPSSQVGVATISLILAMVSLAFFVYDFPKPRILMGDGGSTFLGFVIATLAIFSGGKVATAFLVLGIPILDMIWVVLRRIFGGQKFWKGDLKHLHHRLLDLGFSERKVVILYLIVTAFFGFAAVSFVSSQQKFFILIGLVALMLLLAGALVLIPNKK